MALIHKATSIKEEAAKRKQEKEIPENLDITLDAVLELGGIVSDLVDAVTELGALVAPDEEGPME